ncbi:pyridoxamine 5'-phosphate oxidase [Rhodohalobacter barkolensis]|uniref:Pyridoxamine 5'-phosphate oxidase n=1 Tax=Rhodohalobacter barkolensis TaxID=2053187 RepID=A0A2N0VF44_9BACT|nr:pyridoxamine 5'-phosphate oxidase [Rhodohalobacter barkolensis]PKD42807.1 pyridoxamine 5'-phosphate oxidase [Rhodohalobacter barkolensis]
MTDIKIADLRKQYKKGGLVDLDLPDNPIELFRKWFEEAVESEVVEPNAMALATVTGAETPNVRMVLLKGLDEYSISFFTNYESQKAKELNAYPVAACTIWWAELERQVRFSGKVEKLTAAESEDYFRSRPKESQIGAWASDQSKPIADRTELEARFKEIEEKFEGGEIPRPDYWGGYKIILETIEFWQGRPRRLHDRILYQQSSGKWNRQRLAP